MNVKVLFYIMLNGLFCGVSKYIVCGSVVKHRYFNNIDTGIFKTTQSCIWLRRIFGFLDLDFWILNEDWPRTQPFYILVSFNPRLGQI